MSIMEILTVEDFPNVCRICMGRTILKPLEISTLDLLKSVTKIEIDLDDGLPNHACCECIKILDELLSFLVIIRNNETCLKQVLDVWKLKNKSINTSCTELNGKECKVKQDKNIQRNLTEYNAHSVALPKIKEKYSSQQNTQNNLNSSELIYLNIREDCSKMSNQINLLCYESVEQNFFEHSYCKTLESIDNEPRVINTFAEVKSLSHDKHNDSSDNVITFNVKLLTQHNSTKEDYNSELVQSEHQVDSEIYDFENSTKEDDNSELVQSENQLDSEIYDLETLDDESTNGNCNEEEQLIQNTTIEQPEKKHIQCSHFEKSLVTKYCRVIIPSKQKKIVLKDTENSDLETIKTNWTILCSDESNMEKRENATQNNDFAENLEPKKKRRRQKIQCSDCGKMIAPFHWERHLARHSEAEAKKNKTSAENVEPKKKKPRPKIQCTECGKLVTRNRFKLHLATHSNDKPYECKLCLKTFKTHGNLTRHDKISHKGLKPYKCEMCDLEFTTATARKDHMFRHTGVPDFFCTECNAVFPSWSVLSQHCYLHKLWDGRIASNIIKPVQDELGNFSGECYLCKRKLETRQVHQHIRGHYRSSNGRKGGITKYVNRLKTLRICPYCGKQVLNLSHHILIHGERKQNCGLCDKSFFLRAQLTSHMMTHTGEKPCMCKYCGQRFALAGNLRVHERIHTGERPFKCNICGKGFCGRSPLNKHKKNCGRASEVIRKLVHTKEKMQKYREESAESADESDSGRNINNVWI